jgi:exopolysaccharide biosynthesis polyprenyl glycosylphosphotransferase
VRATSTAVAVVDADEHAAAFRRLRSRLRLTDFAVITWAVFGAQLLRFGTVFPAEAGTAFEAASFGFSILLVAAWWLTLVVHGAYDLHGLGHGPEEYRAIAAATLRVFAVLALFSYAFRLNIARGYVLIALPAGLLGLLVARWVWRRWLGYRRAEGRLTHSVLVVGDVDHLTDLIHTLGATNDAGYRVVAACTSTGEDVVGGVPVTGGEAQAAEVARAMGVDVVACTSSVRLGPRGLRRLGWDLEGTGIQLVVVPGLTDVAGPRVLTRPVAGLPLLHVEAPVFSGPKLFVKTAIDIAGAAFLIVVLSPVLLATAAAVWLQDRGPVFFFQRRIGLEGRPFPMVKFRSMVVDAEDRLQQLQDAHDETALDRGPLFKLTRDPRVTPVGRFIRRFSLDELPQLFNVLRGEMSLVGPRPPLPCEVDQYAEDVRRRLLVKPGMTGLWQVNGRSDLSWEESVRFDLYYVENWSVLSDLMILWRTAYAVFKGPGAY